MRILIILLTFLFLTTSSFASEISEAGVKAFIDNWLAAQNMGSYSNYAGMYSNSFIGIKRSGSSTFKLNHDAWLKDRKKMFSKKMVVKANNPEVKVTGTTASVKFEQTWESGAYKDVGNKILNLVSENGKFKIVREEMLFSNKLVTGDFKNNSNVADTDSIDLNKSSTDNSKYISKTTSIKNKDCKKISNKISKYFDNRNLDRSECPAPAGWRLFTVIGGEYYWLEIAYGSLLWSTEDEVITKGENRFGNFQSIDFEKVEWRISTTGELNALIFPVVAQNPEIYDQSLYRLFIIKFTENIPYFCGVAKTNREARDIADKSTNCFSMLPQKVIPKLQEPWKGISVK